MHVVPKSPFFALITAELAQVSTLIQQRLNTDVALIAYAARYLAAAPDHHTRPAMALIAAKALGDIGPRQHLLAAAVELIHAALALHHGVDQVEAETPSGLGNAPSVLLGDLLYTSAFRAIVELGDMRVLRVLADATNQIAEGSVMYQLAYQSPRPQATAEAACAQHLRITQARTASLFAAAARSAAILAGAPPTTETALAAYGQRWGTWWQLSRELETQAPAGRPGALTEADLRQALSEAKDDLLSAQQGLNLLPDSVYRHLLQQAVSPA